MTDTLHIAPHELRGQVLEELSWSPDVRAERIDAASSAGVVTLSGQVESLPEKAAAVRAALRVRGVSVVVDLVGVRPGALPRPDTDVSRDATAVLAHTRHATSSVQAGVVDQVITLTGVVTWHFQKQDAEDTVRSVPGAVGVVNAITLAPTSPFSAPQAAALVTAALRRSAAVDAANVHVTTSGSTVELFGHVSSATQRDEAGATAWSAPGVTEVTNNLRVLDFGTPG